MLDTADLSSRTQNECLKLLYKTCGHYALLPRVLNVPVHYDRNTDEVYRGGYADVWKGEYCGQDVAIKVIRTYSKCELKKVINVSCRLCALPTYRVIDITRCTEILQGDCDVEVPPTSECPTVNRGGDVKESVRDGISLDVQREYQRIRQGSPGCEPA